MKKILALALAMIMIVSLAACDGGNDTPDPSGSEDSTPSSSQQQEQPSSTPDPGTSGSAEGGDIAAANAYLTERGFDGFAFPEDLTVVEMELMDSPATIAGRVEVTFCPVEKDKYDEILTALFSGTGMTALNTASEAAASLDECLSMLSSDEMIEHDFFFEEPDWNYSVSVTYFPSGGEHGLYGTIEAQTLMIDIQHGMKK